MTRMNDPHAVPGAFFPSYDVLRPLHQRAAFVFSSPHSGRLYPPEFLALSRLDPLSLRRSEDCFVDHLFSGCAALGAPLLSARFPRAYLDLNREPYEIDPDLVDDMVPPHANSQSIRVMGGLGTVARVVADGEEIYREKLPISALMTRIDQLYFPFHAELSRLIEQTKEQFGYAILIDCHSMPSTAMTPGGNSRPDIVVGDRFGASCDQRLSILAREAFRRRGYTVQMNRPYAGGYITEHHGRPGRAVHALQLEINRGLYLNEKALEPNDGFAGLQRDLTAIAADLFEAAPQLFERRAAAE